jgi:RNA polymerase sigma-70 factor, ECF subfamily
MSIPLRDFGKRGVKISALGLGGHHLGGAKDEKTAIEGPCMFAVNEETPPGRGCLMNALNPSASDVAIECDLHEMPEGLLLSAAKSGDAIAFVELSERHSDMILRQAYRIVKNWQDAEDVLQESLIRAFVHLKEFEERCSFSSWLARIAINFSLMKLRKMRGHTEISMEVINDEQGSQYCWEPRDPAESPESRYVRREREEALQGAIRQLPPKLRQIVQMKIIDGRSGEEVSQTLGISVQAAKSRLARAKIALRLSLTPED